MLGIGRVSARQGWAGEMPGLFEHPAHEARAIDLEPAPFLVPPAGNGAAEPFNLALIIPEDFYCNR